MRLDEFHVSKSLLEQAGITVLDLDTSAHVTIAGGNVGYDLLVLDEDAIRARRLLQCYDGPCGE